MLVWFAFIGAIGLMEIMQTPAILQAINPFHAYAFAHANPWLAFISMGSVVLAITGAEALYADMGHFGREPIQKAWLWLVFPCLLLNYFWPGRTALPPAGNSHQPLLPHGS